MKMMQPEFFTYERYVRGDAPWELSVARVMPEGEPRFCVQFIHGFSERKERWIPFMRVIAACGGIALIHALRGHGATRCAAENPKPGDELARFGYDREILFDDIDHVYEAYGIPAFFSEPAADEQGAPADGQEQDVTPDAPADGQERDEPREQTAAVPAGIPRFLLGHSMGALIAGLYAAHDDRRAQIDGLILTGLPRRERMVSLGLAGLGFLGFFAGDGAKPKLLNRSAFTRYNRGFEPEPESDGYLWMTNDPEVRRAFASDPLCRRDHPVIDYRNLLRLVRDFYRPASWDKPPKDFPVLLMAGERDPIAGGDEHMLDARQFLHDMGFEAAEARMYRGGRHEIFFDTEKEAPYTDAVRFVLANLPKELS